jgi:hypothetical protein
MSSFSLARFGAFKLMEKPRRTSQSFSTAASAGRHLKAGCSGSAQGFGHRFEFSVHAGFLSIAFHQQMRSGGLVRFQSLCLAETLQREPVGNFYGGG